MKKNDHQVFISYSSKDIKECEAIRDQLESEGIVCWMAPRDILPGDAYASAIIDAIGAAKICLVFVSEHSNVSVQVQKEIDRAVNAKLKIIAFLLQKVELSKALNYYLCDSHWIASEGLKATEAYGKLSEAVHHHLQHGEAPPPLPGGGNSLSPELKAHAQWQRKFLWPTLIVAIVCALIGGSLLWRPNWPGQLWTRFVGRSQDLKIQALPTQSLGRWTERFGKRMLQTFNPNTKWLEPAFPYLMDKKELEQKSMEELLELREEIKARHGIYFEDPVWQKHFEDTSWYRAVKGTAPSTETNAAILAKMPFVDEDNTFLVEDVILEKMNSHLLKDNPYVQDIYTKIYPIIYFDVAAAYLDPSQRDLERLSFNVANTVANNLAVDKEIPALWGPMDLNSIDMKNPWSYFQGQQSPMLLYVSFVGEDGNGIQIFHAENEASMAAANELKQIITQIMNDNPELYPWKTVLAGNHEILNYNPQGISLLVHVNAPEDLQDFGQMELASEFLTDALMELVLRQFKLKSAYKNPKK